jgi:hypothetical protein
MGVLAHRLRMLDCSLVPHRHEWKFSGARVCRVTFKHLPQPLRSHILSFETLGQHFPFSALGDPQIFDVGWREERRKIMTSTMATYVYASAHTPLRPIIDNEC